MKSTKHMVARSVAAMLAGLALLTTGPAFAEGPPININTASPTELTALNGIGPAKAQAIVEHREASGSFSSVDDLKLVRGIGDKLLEHLRPHVTVGTEETEGTEGTKKKAPEQAKHSKSDS